MNLSPIDISYHYYLNFNALRASVRGCLFPGVPMMKVSNLSLEASFVALDRLVQTKCVENYFSGLCFIYLALGCEIGTLNMVL